MSVPADILDQPERLAKPLAGSVVFHTLVFAGVLFSSWVGAKARDSWGTPNSVPGGSMTINVV